MVCADWNMLKCIAVSALDAGLLATSQYSVFLGFPVSISKC